MSLAEQFAEMDKPKKIKLGFAVVALFLGGAGIAYSFGLFDALVGNKVKPGTAEVGVNAPLVPKVELTPDEVKQEEEAAAMQKEATKDIPKNGS